MNCLIVDSEVCEWGKLANELNEPAYDICLIVAVALKDQNDLRQTAPSSSSSYSNYDCPKIPVANVAQPEEADSLDDPVAQRALVCPRITINDPTTRERITLERFFIADGDYSQNSVFVFGPSHNTFGSMDLKFYLSDIFKINSINVSSRSVNNFQSVLDDLQRNIELNELCNSPLAERQNVCKYSAMKKFCDNDETVLQRGDFDFDATHLDTSGFVPYRCFKRCASPPLAAPRSVAVRLRYGESEDHIYCPKQFIKLGDSVMAQAAFFYSISDDLYEKRIHLKKTVGLVFRDDHKIEETTVLPFP